MSAETPPSRLDSVKRGARRALTFAVVVGILIVAAILTVHFTIFVPQLQRVEQARDAALAANAALAARARAIEARYALAVGDYAGAQAAVADVRARIATLEKEASRTDATTASALKDLGARAGLVENEMRSDSEAARRDLELIEARLGTLYPAPPGSGK
jgi:hypothetical protein